MTIIGILSKTSQFYRLELITFSMTMFASFIFHFLLTFGLSETFKLYQIILFFLLPGGAVYSPALTDFTFMIKVIP